MWLGCAGREARQREREGGPGSSTEWAREQKGQVRAKSHVAQLHGWWRGLQGCPGATRGLPGGVRAQGTDRVTGQCIPVDREERRGRTAPLNADGLGVIRNGLNVPAEPRFQLWWHLGVT